MKEGPDISHIAALIGDPARANMLTALMSGKALTATELSQEAGVTLQTASSHLAKLEQGGLTCQTKQGRHRYYTLADEDVGDLLEAIMGLAEKRGQLRTRTGPKDPALRKARVCYNHLAGDMGVQLFDSLKSRGLISEHNGDPLLSEHGQAFVQEFGIDLTALTSQKRPICRSCLDWSARRTHLAGSLGSALLQRFEALGWARRHRGTRIVAFTPEGERQFHLEFPRSSGGADGGNA